MDKDGIRAAHRERRRRAPGTAEGVPEELARGLAAILVRSGIERPTVLAGYLPIRNEPDVTAAMAGCWRSGSLVVVPRTLPGHRLEWCPWTPSSPLVPDRHGLSAPTTAARPDALRGAGGAILVPALAVDRRGHRLGQGAGYYDRALADVARWPAGPLRIAVVNPDEVVDGELPHEPHDAPMDAVLTSDGWFDCLAR